MTYLYAGLGVAMLAGIMAIFEMGLSLTGQSLINDRVDAYLVSDQAKVLDRQVLAALLTPELKESGLEGYELCEKIRELVLGVANAAEQSSASPCVLVSSQHLDERDGLNPTLQKQGYLQRVVVFRDSSDSQMPYRLFSCLIPPNPPIPQLSVCEQGGTANG